MSTQSQPAGESEAIAFLEKLAAFNETLTPTEQTWLDQMTAAALSNEVQGYGSLPAIGTVIASPTLLTARAYYYRVGALLDASSGPAARL